MRMERALPVIAVTLSSRELSSCLALAQRRHRSRLVAGWGLDVLPKASPALVLRDHMCLDLRRDVGLIA